MSESVKGIRETGVSIFAGECPPSLGDTEPGRAR